MAARTRPLKLNRLDATTRQNRINPARFQDPGNRSKYWAERQEYAKYATCCRKYKKQRAHDARLDAGRGWRDADQPGSSHASATTRSTYGSGKDAVAKAQGRRGQGRRVLPDFTSIASAVGGQMRELAMAQRRTQRTLWRPRSLPQPAASDADPDVLSRSKQTRIARRHRRRSSGRSVTRTRRTLPLRPGWLALNFSTRSSPGRSGCRLLPNRSARSRWTTKPSARLRSLVLCLLLLIALRLWRSRQKQTLLKAAAAQGAGLNARRPPLATGQPRRSLQRKNSRRSRSRRRRVR